MKIRIRNTAELKALMATLLQSAGGGAEEEQKVLDTLDQVDIQPAYLTDKLIYRIVVISLGLTVLGFMTAVAILMLKTPCQNTTKEIPVALITLSATAMGALTGLLAPSPKQNDAA